jgi:hypothetical protein
MRRAPSAVAVASLLIACGARSNPGAPAPAPSGADEVAEPASEVFFVANHGWPEDRTHPYFQWQLDSIAWNGPRGAIVDGPCVLAEAPADSTRNFWWGLQWGEALPVPFAPLPDLDVGTLQIETADGRHRWSDPNERAWSDGELLVVTSRFGTVVPPFRRQIRAASALQITKPVATSTRAATVLERGRPFEIAWTSEDDEQGALVVLTGNDWNGDHVAHTRDAYCRGGGGTLVIPASVVAFITEPPWPTTVRAWTVAAERREIIASEKAMVTITTRTPQLPMSFEDWTPIAVE